MSARQPGPYDSVARKWLALAERRQAHFSELGASGRWRHYFTEAELDQEIRQAKLLRDRWARIAGLLPDDDEEPEEAFAA
jgi:hypothetical protein